MAETTPVLQRSTKGPAKTREEPASSASRIPVKQRPAQPPLHVRTSQTKPSVETHVYPGHCIPHPPLRRGRSSSFANQPPTTIIKPSSYTSQPPKRPGSGPDPLSSPGPSPTPSPSQSLNLRTSLGPLPSRPPQFVTTPANSRTTQGVTPPPSTNIPRPPQGALYKRAQSVGVTSHVSAEAARLKLIERATKARLYLLHQSGPNRFLIGGDAPDSRFHVTIGPQNCTCGKQHCIHLLFVMLRVLKVPPSDHLLWSKQLRNYEAETLLQELHARNTQRTTPKKINKRRFDFTVQKMNTIGGLSSLFKTGSDDQDDEESKREKELTCTKGSLETEFGVEQQREAGDGESGGVERGESGEGERGDSDKSEDEDVCPICLNELDEGEDLITCRRCVNRLHQHCMDIWAGEQIRKKEVVQCPVCRTSWQYSSSSVSPGQAGSQAFLQVSIPVGEEGEGERGAGGGGLRLKSLSPSQMQLSEEKALMVEKIRKVFGLQVVDGILSPDWRSREMAIAHTSREVVSLLLPKMKVIPPSCVAASTNWREIQDATFLVIMNGCSDSVLKVFLASLELLRVLLGYSVCSTEEDCTFIQALLQPLLLSLLTRCADAQSRVKECCIDTVCHFCLGQEGPLSLGSACGQTSPLCVSSLPFVMRCALKREDFGSDPGNAHSWHWWLGRLNFFERIIQRFSWDFLLENCIYRPPFSPPSPDPEDSLTSVSSMRSMEAPPSSLEFPSDDDEPQTTTKEDREPTRDSLTVSASNVARRSPRGSPKEYLLAPPPFPHHSTSRAVPLFHPSTENNLLAQVWYFAAHATHVPHNKVGKVARRVIIRIAKVLRNEPFSLEIVHDVVSKCHRTQAEGLLDRVLAAREKPVSSTNTDTTQSQDVQRREKAKEPSAARGKEEVEAVGKKDLWSSPQPYAPFPETRRKQRETKQGSPHVGVASEGEGGVSDSRRLSEYGSDDSYRSAVSDLSGEEKEDQGDSDKTEVRREVPGSEVQSSSGTSTDSKFDDRQAKDSTSGGNGDDVTQLPRYYKRQTTADSVFSNSSTDPETSGGIYLCKRNIEEEEAAAEAKVRSMLPEDVPHPSLFGIRPPNPEVLIHVQTGAEGTDDASSTYIEGKQWVKGKLIGTGAFCSCFLARDTRLGTMMAVKQVSYVRNTKTEEEEELKRLHDEVMMLGRLSHPNVVRCLGATQHEGHINIFIEWMAGGCLDQVLHDFGPFAESVICNYTRQIVYGIVYLHEHGIIHRDLKGGNVLLDSTGQRIRIADFGAAARLASHTTGQGEFQDMEGTVAFMAPEVVRGGTTEEGSTTGYGRKCDVWSIGCVIIQMATAKPPWAGTYDVKNKFQLVFKIGQATEPPPMPPFSEPALRDLTLRCLEVNPEERPVSSELLKHPLFTST